LVILGLQTSSQVSYSCKIWGILCRRADSIEPQELVGLQHSPQAFVSSFRTELRTIQEVPGNFQRIIDLFKFITMRQWYLCKVKYSKENEEGLLKGVSEQYLVDGVSFSETEAILYDRLGSQIRGDFSVRAISISNVVDIFLYEDSDLWHKCKITYLIADGESGKEKKVTQYMLVTADGVEQAHQRIQESLSNTLVSFRVPDVVESSIIDVFPYEKPEELPAGNFRSVIINEGEDS